MKDEEMPANDKNLKKCAPKRRITSYPLPPRTQLSIKGIPMSINILPPTLPGCGILNFVKNCNAQMLGSLNAEKNRTKFPLVIDFINFVDLLETHRQWS